MNKIFILYGIIFVALLCLCEKYKLYNQPKYKFYIKLFISANVMFTIYVIYFQASNHNEEIINNHSDFYNKIMGDLKHGTLFLLNSNPKMKYYFDELIHTNNNNNDNNDNEMYSVSEYLTHRDPHMELAITYKIMDVFTDFAVFYYSHVNLDNYNTLMISQRYTVLKTFNMYLNSKIFRENLDIYLNHIKNFISYIELCFLSNNGPFNNANVDITYHFCKFMYCIFKNLFDKNSSIIKINYNFTNNSMNFWSLFKKYILHLFVYQFVAIFKLPNVVDTLNTFYPAIAEFISLFDNEFQTNYLVDYKNHISQLESMVFPDDLPNDFLDPILFTPIKNPMILPESGIIIDRTVIMSYLLENNYDPFNRQPITFEQLEQFNSLENIKEKCLEFIIKRDTWTKEANVKIQNN